mmetsp:Transcript_41620/g.50641  ORF Transcript_41620/g.50641 Transcript_41620/m.50641 type:complete len:80 (-) Transcript_41620:259-498(-)
MILDDNVLKHRRTFHHQKQEHHRPTTYAPHNKTSVYAQHPSKYLSKQVIKNGFRQKQQDTKTAKAVNVALKTPHARASQ